MIKPLKKILLTGANGYIGRNLLPILLKNYHVICCVRNKNNIQFLDPFSPNCEILEIDFLNKEDLKKIPKDIDAAYYLLHSLHEKNFMEKEISIAKNFIDFAKKSSIEQVIYLSGISHQTISSDHLTSRKNVEDLLKKELSLTTLRAGIILGNGSASFEIMRDLIEKLPFMIAPKWVLTKTSPISLHNVLDFLKGVLFFKEAYNQSYDLAGKDSITYKELLLSLAKKRNLKRKILIIPFFTPKLSSYWLYFITSTSYALAKNLVQSLRVPIEPKKNDLAQKLKISLLSLDESLELCFSHLEYSRILFNEKDFHQKNLINYIQIPSYGCFIDSKSVPITNHEKTLENIFNLGGSKKWYGEPLWKIRGFLDSLLGGVGFRKKSTKVKTGSHLNFWRVLLASKEEKRLLLYAEMKLPGEAWLEFSIKNNILYQKATFRPRGLLGRLYWYSLMPFHYIIFKGMINDLKA